MTKRSTVVADGSGKRTRLSVVGDFDDGMFVNLYRFENMRNYFEYLHARRIPIMFEGPMGSGKSTLLEHLHANFGPLTHNGADAESSPQDMVVLNLGEQTDAKALFGAFIAHPERPGEFFWKAGVIVDAMQRGLWLIIEDIDLAGTEMLALLKGLLEAKDRFFIPAMSQDVLIHQDFRIYASRRCDGAFHAANPTGSAMIDRLGKDLWQVIRLEAFSDDEIRQLATARFPRLEPIVSIVIAIFGKVKQQESASGLFKFCRRLNYALPSTLTAQDGSVSEEVRLVLLREAVDCFASAWFERSSRAAFAHDLSSTLLALGHSEASLGEQLFECKPEIALSADRRSLAIGRVVFSAESEGHLPFSALAPSGTLAMTTLTAQTLEKLAVAVKHNEPVLLVGETGTGKTTAVQALAKMLNPRGQQTLRVINMSQASEASDLLGGYKPFSASTLARSLFNQFTAVFERSLSQSKNVEFLAAAQDAFDTQNWKRFVRLLLHALGALKSKLNQHTHLRGNDLSSALESLEAGIRKFEQQSLAASSGLLFSFVEGALVDALVNGHWILLDELNLAGPETLHILAGLLRESSASLTLTERGDREPLKRHPNFRLFACMNPATDVGKRDLPPALKSRFSTIYVDETDCRRADLRQVIEHLLGPGRDGTLKESLTALYYELKDLVVECRLVDGNGRRPLLNLRTLSRPIKFARKCEVFYGIDRALFEGWWLSFGTVLDQPSILVFRNLLLKYLGGAKKDTFDRALQPAKGAIPPNSAIIDGYVLGLGSLPEVPVDACKNFILTPSVKRNVAQLARAVMAHSYPILLEGPTSAGKTSVISYLAARTGHHCVRINNHEHTDLQEYLGTYVADPNTGQLVFREGVLVQALRHGHWLILDELNLAPSDILEALNRLLDDNRELFLPETGEVVHPHPNFLLFATQNPAGSVYGGRKALSRAFRSRFLELQMNELPLDEIEQILAAKTAIAPPFARRIAIVYRQLQERRSAGGANIFAGKHSLITLRDCFRWAERQPGTIEELAEDGYFVLAERCRSSDERLNVRCAIELVCKLKLPNDTELYNLAALARRRAWDESLIEKLASLPQHAQAALNLTWTKPMQRLATLVYLAMRHQQALLLVGETGCGKTTVVQLLAAFMSKTLFSVSAHANSEASDFLGSFRPVRHDEDVESGRLFEWQDGPLVEALVRGQWFLLDEISLAEDSVLERLNSVLEASRTLLLTGSNADDSLARSITAHGDFAFFATMNPGGDFGKKELSPALRNRFTEVWVPSIGDADDLLMIIASRLDMPSNAPIVHVIREYWFWWQEQTTATVTSATSGMLAAVKRFGASLRDLTSLLDFVKSSSISHTIQSPELRLLHGAAMLFTDRLGSDSTSLRLNALAFLADRLHLSMADDNVALVLNERLAHISETDSAFSAGPFSLQKRSATPSSDTASQSPFAFEADTTKVSVMRVLRAMQLGKAVLLEGSPGVGKTTLISAIAAACRVQLTRINLSEQTDLVDLFGSDLPVENEPPGTFRWCDGPFLQALKRGDWILLDELNLASQSVLEGLNACLDHRGTVFIPELGREFTVAVGTRIFAAQNPAGQGGGRKGLPKSFLNRFTIVWCDALTVTDYSKILHHLLPERIELIEKMILFNNHLITQVVEQGAFATAGRPWEFNLRDLMRWIKLISLYPHVHPVTFIRPLYAARFRSLKDQAALHKVVCSVFGQDAGREYCMRPPVYDLAVVPQTLQLGAFTFDCQAPLKHLILPGQIAALEAAAFAVQMQWLCILTGPAGSGKSVVIDILAALHQKKCRRFYMSPDTDALELLGSFEQVDTDRRWNMFLEDLSANGIDLTFMDMQEMSMANVLAHLKPACTATPAAKEALDKFEAALSMPSEGRFEWVDGPLVRAMTLGDWLVLDGANLASSAVLDRLNSLFEPDGYLALSEQGISSGRDSIRIVRPAKGFRLFMTVNPQFGEISRAMRNRGLEVALLPAGTFILDEYRLECSTLPSTPHHELISRLSFANNRRALLRPAENGKEGNFDLSSADSSVVYWLRNGHMLKYDDWFPSALQSAIVEIEAQQSPLLSQICALLLYFGRWLNYVPDSLPSRLSLFGDLFSVPSLVDLSAHRSPLAVTIWLIRNWFNLSTDDEGLLQQLGQHADVPMIQGFLVWMLVVGRTKSVQVLSPFRRSLQFFLQGLPSDIGDWAAKWRTFGFNNAATLDLYCRLQSLLQSHQLAFIPEAFEVFEAMNQALTLPSSDSGELVHELGAFVNLVGNKIAAYSPSGFEVLLLGPIKLSRMLGSSFSSLLAPSKETLTIEWMSCIWKQHLTDPVSFFTGNDGLGAQLASLTSTWRFRKVRDERELLRLCRELAVMIAEHGAKDGRRDRLALLKNMFMPSTSASIQEFPSQLLQFGLEQLKSFTVPFDPVTDVYQARYDALSTALSVSVTLQEHEKHFQTAYTGTYIPYPEDEISASATKGALNQIKQYLLVRGPDAESLFKQLQEMLSTNGPIQSIINQASAAVTASSFPMVLSSLIRVRFDLLSKFVPFRDLIAPLLIGLDAVGAALCLMQEQKVTDLDMLPLSLFAPIKSGGTLSSALVSLKLASIAQPASPDTGAILAVAEKVHAGIMEGVQAAASDVFHFEGSKNDDDALDETLAKDLFAGATFVDEKTLLQAPNLGDEDMAPSTECTHPAAKSVTYPELAMELAAVCESLASGSPAVKDAISWIYNFLNQTIDTSSANDEQIYRMLLWTIAEVLNRRNEVGSTVYKGKRKHGRQLDFYRDAVPVAELDHAVNVLHGLSARVSQLQADWPDHDVLQGIIHLVQKFLNLPVNGTPMYTALQLLERLYLRSLDWEKYAASGSQGTQLGEHLSLLIHLIIGWRKIELECWKALLDAVVERMEIDDLGRSGEFLVILRLALSHTDDLSSVLELIDTFMLSSPIGQFNRRLKLLSVASQLSAKSRGSAAPVFRTAHAYYATSFGVRIKDYLRRCRGPVETDLSTFLQTLNWKDTNYWQVRQVADKSHRHLAKMVRKWKEAVGMPLSALLNQLQIRPQLERIDQHVSVQEKPPKALCSNDALFKKAAARLQAVAGRLAPLGSQVVHNLGDLIIDTLKELQASTDPSIQPKQKAFIDLIKVLKTLGVRINRPVPESASAKSALLGWSACCPTASGLESTEAYFVKALEKWSKLMNSVPHEDITFRHGEIIRNSTAYLILDILASGELCQQRAQIANLHADLASLGCDLQKVDPDSLVVSFQSVERLLDATRMLRSQLSLCLVEFEAQRSIGVAPQLLSLFGEKLRIMDSSCAEIIRLLETARPSLPAPVYMSAILSHRIRTLVSSLQLSQVPDLTVDIAQPLAALMENVQSSDLVPLELGQTDEEHHIVHPLLRLIQSLESDIVVPDVSQLDQYNLYPDYLRKHSYSIQQLHTAADSLQSLIKTALGSYLTATTRDLLLLASQQVMQLLDGLAVKQFQALARLALILSNVFLHLYLEGFCRPPPADEAQQEGESEDKDGKATAGTGMGEGSGQENVSKEIEFEEQVTGLMDEEPSEEDKTNKDKKENDQDQIDMSQDFDGQLHDLMDDSESKDQDEDDQPEEQDEQLDDQMLDKEDRENLNNDDEQIQDLDPSWWNDDDDDDEQEDVPDQDKNAKKLPDKDQSKQSSMDEDQDPQDTKDESSNANDDTKSADQDNQKGSNADEPHDNAEAKSDQEDDSNMDLDNASALDETEADAPAAEVETEVQGESDAEDKDEAAKETEMDVQEAEEQQDTDVGSEADNSETLDDVPMNSEQLSEEYQQEAEPEAAEQEPGPEKEDNHAVPPKQELSVDDDMTGGLGEDSSDVTAMPSENSATGNQVRTLDERSDNAHDQPSPSQSTEHQPSTPLEKWRKTTRRLQEQKDESSAAVEADEQALTREQRYEHADEQDEKAVTVQAEAEQAVHSKDSKIDDGKDAAAAIEENAKKDTDAEDKAQEAPIPELEEELKDLKLVPRLHPVEMAVEELAAPAPLPADALPSWGEYEAKTSELAFELCEQLRLVLAPTLATKLRGDYRTGKRLNMRKILPYIASQYRRDKIWLRRTRPSQRNYRICLAIDNSHSMADTGSVSLAFEAIATISQALERLEVGELSLIGFGDEAHVLQPFSPGVAKVLDGEQLQGQQLKFNDASTNMENLLNCVLDTFMDATAASSSASGQTWQLNLILSDGICHNHNQIRPLIAKCLSARLLNLFIILDSRPEGSTIYDLSHVEYTDAGVDPLTGAMRTGIKMTKYLETFPFDLYVVLRDVRMLPAVLADALKQWFEFVSNQE